VLELTAHLPEHTFEPGHVVLTEGSHGSMLWVLVSGALRIIRHGITVNTVTASGSVLGEMAVLLEQPHSATVETTEATVLRYAEDGSALLDGEPEFTRLIAVGLAERLSFVTTYLADLQHQYGDAPGLAMIPDVIAQLSQRRVDRATHGSVRDPDL
jgi:CRP/FNR family transcriptional regulator, cyclic AMP receptor protein